MLKRAWITGASSGIGAATARLLAKQNMHLTLSGRDTMKLNALAAELEGITEVCAGDLTTKEGRKKVVDGISANAPDLVINSAGAGLYGDILSHPLKSELALLELNAAAVLELTIAAATALKRAGKSGIILNVSSVAAFFPFPGLAVYGASKAFVNQFSLAMDYELRSDNIRVLTSCPGVVASEFRYRAGGAAGNDRGAMTVEYAAEQLWWQIQKQRPLHIFDWRYRLATRLACLMPCCWKAFFLRRAISAFTLPSR